MRAKELKLIITFHTTAEAIAMERYCKEHQLTGRLIPVPRQISTGCGLAFAAPPEQGAMMYQKLTQDGMAWESWQEIIF